MTIVRRECPAAKLLLVGDGHTRPALQAMVRQRGLEDAVSFVGRVRFEEVPWWIGASDVCVVLHRSVRFYPGDSMKLWEYLACARPVVATAGEGYGDMVERLGAGLSVKEEDPAGACRGRASPTPGPCLGEEDGASRTCGCCALPYMGRESDGTGTGVQGGGC